MLSNRFLRLFPLTVVFMFVNNMSGQDVVSNKAVEQQEEYIRREIEYEEAWLKDHIYHDADADSLYFLNSLYCSDGKFYFFRRTPLSFKTGWTNIFSKDEVDFNIILSSIPPTPRNGIKGYTITWLLKKDSLFIKDITLRIAPYGKPNNNKKELQRDTILSRLEKFTNLKFTNGLMFADWVSGDFGVITRHTKSPKEHFDNFWEYSESYCNGMLISFKNGLVKTFQGDIRDNKH